ncbi:preprotein translocase subunit SecF [Nakamurella sp. UYEF19]|uniref:protein translocase subunit SecF n=1 Tax=Nakamurella sp. UYEF19 TaxID=1756392 RepID=UPI00339B51DB
MAPEATATKPGEEVSHDEIVRLNKAIHTGSFISRLTTGTGAFDILGKRRYYYMFSGFLVVASILVIIIRGFHLGTDFAGGTKFTFIPSSNVAGANTERVTEVLDKAIGSDLVEKVQTLGGNTVQATLKALTGQQVIAGKDALNTTFTPVGGVSASDVSSTWGAQISDRAILAVIIFLILVGVFIWVRYEKRAAAAAVLSTVHDVLVTAGIYALAGFEVTPATVIGLLTILGFSLYDTVVVYDKVQENAKGLTSLLRRNYAESANLALNQTIMRSLNTSLIALLPVAGLLVAGVAVLGGGTLKDLALVLLVGMLVGAYSSIFVAVPVAVDLKIREPVIKAHTARVLAKRRADGTIVDADGDPVGHKTSTGTEHVRRSTVVAPPVVPGMKAGAPPKPGVKPQRAGRPVVAKPLVSPVAPKIASKRLGAKPAGPSGAAASTSSNSAASARAERPAHGEASDASASLVDTAPAVGAPAVDAATDTAIDAAVGGSVSSRSPGSAKSTGKVARPSGKATRPTGKRGR